MESVLLDLSVIAFAALCLWKARLHTSLAEQPLERSSTSALKGILAIVVVLHHLSQRIWAGNLFQRFSGIGYIAVAVFLFLTGYGLQKQALARPDYLKGYFARRILPVLLPYALMTVLFWGINAINGTPVTFPGIFAAALLRGDPIVPFSWYVISILAFYAVFALMLKLFKNRRRLPLYAAVYTALYIALLRTANFGAWWYNTAPLLPLGMLYALQEDAAVCFLKRRYWFLSIPCWLLFAAMYNITDRLMGSQYGSMLCVACTVLTAALCMLSLVTLLMKLRIGNSVLDFLGKYSYEIYLCQGICMVLLRSNIVQVWMDLLYCILTLAGTLVLAPLLKAAIKAMLSQSHII